MLSHQCKRTLKVLVYLNLSFIAHSFGRSHYSSCLRKVLFISITFAGLFITSEIFKEINVVLVQTTLYWGNLQPLTATKKTFSGNKAIYLTAFLLVIVGAEWTEKDADWGDDQAMTSDLLERHSILDQFLERVKARKEIRTALVVRNESIKNFVF